MQAGRRVRVRTHTAANRLAWRPPCQPDEARPERDGRRVGVHARRTRASGTSPVKVAFCFVCRRETLAVHGSLQIHRADLVDDLARRDGIRALNARTTVASGSPELQRLTLKDLSVRNTPA
jgi:hypothetical protein